MIPRYSQLVNKEVPLVSDLLPFEDVCATFSRVIGRAVKYNPVPADVFAGFGFPGAADLADMFK